MGPGRVFTNAQVYKYGGIYLRRYFYVLRWCQRVGLRGSLFVFTKNLRYPSSLTALKACKIENYTEDFDERLLYSYIDKPIYFISYIMKVISSKLYIISLAEICKNGPDLELRGGKLKIYRDVLYSTPMRQKKLRTLPLQGFEKFLFIYISF